MIQKLIQSPKALVIFIIVIVSLLFNFYASGILNASYEESKFPVPYFEAQLSFSAEKLKSWYSFLNRENTFDIYLKTQYIDFLFILSVLLLHFFTLLLISRLFHEDSKGRKILIVCALLSTIAPIADAVENLVSFIMLANPVNFSNWLAYLYSSLAALKFAMFTFAYIAAIIGLLVGLFSFIKSKRTENV